MWPSSYNRHVTAAASCKYPPPPRQLRWRPVRVGVEERGGSDGSPADHPARSAAPVIRCRTVQVRGHSKQETDAGRAASTPGRSELSLCADQLRRERPNGVRRSETLGPVTQSGWGDPPPPADASDSTGQWRRPGGGQWRLTALIVSELPPGTAGASAEDGGGGAVLDRDAKPSSARRRKTVSPQPLPGWASSAPACPSREGRQVRLRGRAHIACPADETGSLLQSVSTASKVGTSTGKS